MTRFQQGHNGAIVRREQRIQLMLQPVQPQSRSPALIDLNEEYAWQRGQVRVDVFDISDLETHNYLPSQIFDNFPNDHEIVLTSFMA